MSRRCLRPIVIVIACVAGQAWVDHAYAGMAVTVVKAERACFKDLLSVSGVLVPKLEVELRPQSDGLMVSDVLIEPGASVKTGQVLVRFEQPAGAPPRTASLEAPVDGTAFAVSAVIGSYTSASTATPMVRIVADNRLEMKGQIVAAALPKVALGQSATLDIMGLDRLKGTVTAIDPTIDAMTQLGTVRIALDIDARLRPGAFASAQIDAGSACGVALPLSAVLYGPEGAVVQIVADGRVATRHVTVGISAAAGVVQIRDGIEPGETVIERAGGFLRAGDLVHPTAPDPGDE